MSARFETSFAAFIREGEVAQLNELKDAGRMLVVRDLLGRLRLLIEKRPPVAFDALEERLRISAGPFFGGNVLVGTEMLAPEAVFDSPDTYRVGNLSVLEKVAVGAEWTRGPLINEAPRPPRATFYGVKGGVGRSTTLCVWARHLARNGQRVLVVDLDLESPGVSATLLPQDIRPELGIVDWLVEEAVGNDQSDFLGAMAAPSPLAHGAAGQILVAPCMGAAANCYLDKLSRAYLDVPEPRGGTRPFAVRLARLIDQLEREWQPTVVLLDSRAGLHDLAGIATTRLSATTFFFGVGNAQTWEDYRILLRHWMKRPAIAREVRERLKMVAAQVPETGRDSYMEAFRENAWDLFANTLYEEANTEHEDAFSFDLTAIEAPHFPLPIYWSRIFQDWDPLRLDVSEDQIRAAFGAFLDGATELVVDLEADDAEA